MKGGISKSRAQRSRRNLSASREKLLDAIRSKNIGKELPSSHLEQSPVSVDLAQDTTVSPSRKPRLDAASANDPRTNAGTEPLKRSARLQAQQRSAGSEGPVRIASSVPSHGPQLEAGAASEPLASKQARLNRPNTRQFGVEHKEVGRAVNQHEPPKRPYTPVLEPKLEGQEQVPPATRSQERQIGSDGDDNEHQLKRARLTRKNLTHFNKMVRKKGTNNASMSAPPESMTRSTSTKTTSTTTSGFAIKAYENGILDPFSSKPPINYEKIRERYAESRGTASPTESAYEHYVDTVGIAPNEATMVVKPDFVEGLRMQEFRPFPVHKHVNGAVLYNDNPRSLVLPHLAGEWEGPGKDMKKATLQSAYDGAALVYARNQALSLISKPDPPGHAEVTTFTTDGTNLTLYTHYAAPTEDETLEYHQYPIKSTNLIDSHQGLKDGRKGLRNEQDHAFRQSCALRDQLKEHWKQHRDVLHPTAEEAPLPIPDDAFDTTNANEDEAGYEIVEQPSEDYFYRLVLRYVLARVYRADDQIKKAVELLEYVIAVEEKMLAEDYPDRLVLQYELARAYQADGQIKKVVELLEHNVHPCVARRTPVTRQTIVQTPATLKITIASSPSALIAEGIIS
ncbi:hypothetical protein B7494_g3983 [Chlorociboria aeruginascens]|nr:hypothetical protein B7494_g3983 [Chlorociboria aeruginascens]